jgi:hypothetical protein
MRRGTDLTGAGGFVQKYAHGNKGIKGDTLLKSTSPLSSEQEGEMAFPNTESITLLALPKAMRAAYT